VSCFPPWLLLHGLYQWFSYCAFQVSLRLFVSSGLSYLDSGVIIGKGLGCTRDSAFFKFLFIDSITLLLHRRKFVSMIVTALCCCAVIYESGVVLVVW